MAVTESERRYVMAVMAQLGIEFSDFARRLIFEEIDKMTTHVTTLPTDGGNQPRPNPDYREDWEAVHDEANARREAASKAETALMMRYHELTDTDRAEMRQHHAEWEGAHEACKRCLDQYQHRTFEDALTWLNRCFCSDDPVAIADFAPFADVSEMLGAAYRQYQRRRDLEQIESHVLELAEPTRFQPFADAGKCKRIELTLGLSANSEMQALCLIDKIDGELHVAMQGNGHGSVINFCEELIAEFMRQEFPDWVPKRSWFRRKRTPKIQFYTYFPPSTHHTEMFDRVELSVPLATGKRISVQQWRSVGCVPAAVRPNWLPGGLADWPIPFGMFEE